MLPATMPSDPPERASQSAAEAAAWAASAADQPGQGLEHDDDDDDRRQRQGDREHAEAHLATPFDLRDPPGARTIGGPLAELPAAVLLELHLLR
jgi:hypothetical protein